MTNLEKFVTSAGYNMAVWGSRLFTLERMTNFVVSIPRAYNTRVEELFKRAARVNFVNL